VKIDFSQSAQPHSDGRRRQDAQSGSHNDGTRDIGSAPTPVVLLRLLDRNATIEDIAKALRGAEGPGKEGAVGMKRILLIVDRATKLSWGFAFVEFEEVEVSNTCKLGCKSP
jgi:RNA-binding protein 5/10